MAFRGLVIIFLSLCCFNANADLILNNVIYVNAGAVGSNDGSSWENAFTDLQDGLAAAVAGNEIWVAAGTYFPGTARADSFQLKNGVGIYGGFAGGETDRGQRNVKANSTILSGDIGVVGNISDNIIHIFYHPAGTDLDSSAVLDGVTISRGHAYQGSNYGAGMYNEGSSPTIRNCVFEGNRAYLNGAAMYNSNCHPTITGCTFINNTGYRGGGMFNQYCDMTISNCIFNGNKGGSYGGGIYILQSDSTVIHCTFTGNTASNGRGIYDFNSSSLSISNCIFFAGNSTISNEIRSDSTSSVVAYCNITGCGGSGSDWDSSIGSDGGGNIDADPLFVDADGADDIAGTVDDDLRLSMGSPCIDAGNTDLYVIDAADLDRDGDIGEATPYDHAGNVRYCDQINTLDSGYTSSAVGIIVDMGAYESCLDVQIEGDIDRDGDVDCFDLLILAEGWLTGTAG